MQKSEIRAKTKNYSKGKSSETEAKKYLENMGFKLIEANYDCDIGEIDLIMADSDWLVFVEVKFKADDRMGKPEEMISRRKLAQVRRVAEWYLMEHEEMRKRYQKYRIDAVCMLGKEIKHYANCGET